MAMIILLCSALAVYAVHLIRGGRWCGRAATGLAIAAWGTLTGQLVKRGLKAGHWPLTNRYEFALCFVWAIVAVYLLLEASWHADRGERGDRRDPQRQAGVPVLAMALLVATYAVTRPAGEQAIVPLPPVLRSVWLQVHVLTAVVAYGAFGVAAGLALTQWIGLALSFEEGLEREIGRAVALGFPWLTLSILTGAIWAQKAWGRYWGWDPKETWALITWLWVLLILHVRPLRRWRGRRLAVLVVMGFGVVLFTFMGVPWLVRTVRLESLHGF
jgi:ABC-type transport system involved in cytochrome c biogenesis permease subunit